MRRCRCVLATLLLLLATWPGSAEQPARTCQLGLLQPGRLASISGLCLGAPAGGAESRLIRFSLDERELMRLGVSGGWDVLAVKGCVFYSSPGMPILPMRVYVQRFARGTKVLSVSVVSGDVAGLSAKMRLAPGPKPVIWAVANVPGIMVESKSVYSTDGPFPKSLVRYYTGSDGKNTVLIVQFFPLIYYPKTGRVDVVVDATLRIDYTGPGPSSSSLARQEGYRCVIIAPEDMIEPAEALAQTHVEDEGIPTRVVSLAWIRDNYEPAEDPPYPGLADGGAVTPIEYDYTLAKKIISFLRDDEAHPSLEYVTLLGNGAKLPPSYYFFDDQPDLDPINCWIPTDFLYASPDYDLICNYKVGRIPAADPDEATWPILKARRWLSEADWSWFSNVMVAGSRPFHTPFFYGELMSVDLINRGFFDGMTVNKAFGTDGRYTKQVLGSALSDGGYGFLYDSGHGSGFAIHLDDGFISSWDVLGYRSSAWRLPIVVTIACICGRYDSSGDSRFDRSFGEAVVLSQAGGIAFFGGSRINVGIASVGYNRGNVQVIKQEHMGGMTSDLFASYVAGQSDLGGLYSGAVGKFVAENDWDDPLVQRTLFEFVLLGDPAIKIPPYSPGISNAVPLWEAKNADYINNQSVPVYTSCTRKTVLAGVDADSAILSFKLIDATQARVVERLVGPGGHFDYSFVPKGGFSLYTIRAESQDGKEGWIMLNTSSSLLAVDGDITDWRREGLRPIAVDAKGDFDDVEYDLESLWAYADEDFWHFAFDAKCQDYEMYYCLALDYAPGGFTGESGVDTDARNNFVTFAPQFGVDSELYLRHVTWVPWLGWEAFRYCKLFNFAGEGWEEYPFEAVGAFLSYSPGADLVELALPRSQLQDAARLNVILFSLPPGGSQPAQDSVPTDPSTYHTLSYGWAYANTLSRFAQASCAPCNCILAAGVGASKLSSTRGGRFEAIALVDEGQCVVGRIEVFWAGAATGLLLNDEGVNGDAVAGDGVWTLALGLAPQAVRQGQYLVGLVAYDDLGGCVGQWPWLDLSFCSQGVAVQRLGLRQGRVLLSRLHVLRQATTGQDDADCWLLGAVVGNPQTTPDDFHIEAFAVAGPGSRVDSVEVYYDGMPLSIFLNDDGLANDAIAGDGIFSGRFSVSRQALWHREYLLQLVPLCNGKPGPVWPYLSVQP